MTLRRQWFIALLIGAGLVVTSTAQAADVFRVGYAGSMGVVMDRFIGPAFAKATGVEYQGIGQGSYGLARQLEGRLIQADVFLPITPGPVDIVKRAGMIGPAVPVASTQMVIAYSPKSKFVPEFEAATQGKKPWYEVMRTPGFRFGRTDPATDPQGQNIIFTMLLAQNFYKQPGLADQILGGYQNPRQKPVATEDGDRATSQALRLVEARGAKQEHLVIDPGAMLNRRRFLRVEPGRFVNLARQNLSLAAISEIGRRDRLTEIG